MKGMLTGLVLLLSLGLLAGCGGDDDDATTGETTAAQTRQAGGQAGQGAGGKANVAQRGGKGGAKANQGAPAESEEEVLERAEREFRPKPGYDNSIQEFGDEVDGGDREEIVNAMFTFFRAMASSDYKAICRGLTKANVEQLETFLKLKDKQGSCETVLEEILTAPGHVAEARKAAAGTVYQVREEDGNAFVLFVPQGGKASYFVMKREGDAWKATSVTVGTPLIPGT